LHFNGKKQISCDSSSPNFFDTSRFISLDTIYVDDHSRLTLTKKLKQILPILPKDIITVYQDRYSNDLIFTVQHAESNITDSFIIKTKSRGTSTFHNTKTIEKNKEKNSSNQEIIIKKRDTLHDINILIVDNEEDLLKVYEYFLKTEGYRKFYIY
jgi:hypothetical protein